MIAKEKFIFDIESKLVLKVYSQPFESYNIILLLFQSRKCYCSFVTQNYNLKVEVACEVPISCLIVAFFSIW